MKKDITISGIFEKVELYEGYRIKDIPQDLAKDTTFGTFQDYPETVLSILEHSPEDYFDVSAPKKNGEDSYEFEIKLTSDMFPLHSYGLQHFINTIAGDVFYSDNPKYKIKKYRIDKIVWNELEKNTNKNNIDEIRAKFALDDFEPLLAFSFKPRYGLNIDEFIKQSIEVFKAGFHIVEPDTRRIIKNDEEKEKFIDFAKNASTRNQFGSHKKAFSLNLSNRVDDASEIVTLLDDISPLVVKVDGGLDAITIMQSVKKTNPNAIITCYPLLKYALQANHIPSDFYHNALLFAGADIMYPGKQPPLHATNPQRTYGSVESEVLEEGVEYYNEICTEGKFIPTIATGITAGTLHIYYELLGPKVSYFLGGAVALHKKGIGNGAKLCAAILKEAAELRRKKPDQQYVDDISENLQKEIHNSYEGDCYISPKMFLEEIKTLNSYFYSGGK